MHPWQGTPEKKPHREGCGRVLLKEMAMECHIMRLGALW
jgi:hypothetical protein